MALGIGRRHAHGAWSRTLRGPSPVTPVVKPRGRCVCCGPKSSPGAVALVNGVGTLTALLLGLAFSVSLTYAKAARDDVDFVRRRIVDMARPDVAPAGETIPIRSLDQVGALTAAFNLLVARFAAAERSYRADVRQGAEGARERAAFLSGLSHELRTPLNAILGFTHVLETEVDGPLSADAKEELEVIRTSGEHLKNLIDDVLDLSALETGQLRLNRRSIDLRELADDVVREATATVRNKPITLTAKGEGGLLARADPRRVRQILTNLVSNAINATAAGSITVQVEARGSFVALIVQDTGAGIPREETRHHFRGISPGWRCSFAARWCRARPLHRSAPRADAWRDDICRE